jgi:hypothetical protein
MKSVDFERGSYDSYKNTVPVFDGNTRKTQNVSGRITFLEWNRLPPRYKLTALMTQQNFCWDLYYIFFRKLE